MTLTNNASEGDTVKTVDIEIANALDEEVKAKRIIHFQHFNL